MLSKLVTWMRRQSGTTDLRALLYMDEVAGYLPPTANPPTKKPIMTLMKQARAFGVGVVLSTQNPVDVDYKALSNAGTWMIGRLQTERDKARLLDGLSSAARRRRRRRRRRHDLRARQARVRAAPRRQGRGRGVHHPLGDELPARPDDPRPDRPGDGSGVVAGGRSRAGPDAPPATTATAGTAGTAAPATDLAHDETTVMPEVADGVPVRWVDVAAPWLAEAGGRRAAHGSTPRSSPASACATTTRRPTWSTTRSTSACSCPLAESVDVSRAIAVDYDDRDLRTEPPPGASTASAARR